jgi:hypothetical protein
MCHIIANNKAFALLQRKSLSRSFKKWNVVDAEILDICPKIKPNQSKYSIFCKLVDDVFQRLHLSMFDNIHYAFHGHLKNSQAIKI